MRRYTRRLVTVGKSRQNYVFVLPIDDELDMKKAAKAAGEKSLEMLPLKGTDASDRLCARRLYFHWHEEAVPDNHQQEHP